MQIRTALAKLKLTGEITSHSTNTFTHIQLQKWEQYQTSITSEVTNQQQTNNKPITTTKESKEGKERKNNTNTEIAISQKNENEELFEKIQNDTDSILDSMNIPELQIENAKRELFKFWNYWTEKDMRGKERWRKQPTFEVKRRLTSWLLNTKQFTSNHNDYEKK
jgi:hypothetical protein